MNTDRQTDRHTHRHTDRQTDRKTDRQTDRHTHRHTDTQTHRHTDTDTDTHTHTHTRTHMNTHTHTLPALHSTACTNEVEHGQMLHELAESNASSVWTYRYAVLTKEETSVGQIERWSLQEMQCTCKPIIIERVETVLPWPP
jgi:hypothetical protein